MPFEKLTEFLTDEKERVGFILRDGEIVEVENICQSPENGFEVRACDILKYLDEAAASWHTHPGHNKCLSPNDSRAFLNFPQWKHYIVGTDGVACYEVKNGVVVVVG